MSTPPNAVPDAPATPSPPVASALAASRPLFWSMRREVWGNRSIYIAPLAVAIAILVAFTISGRHLPEIVHAIMALDPSRQVELIGKFFAIPTLLIVLTSVLVAVFYCLDALHGERRDRSILFWKSLPVSDLTSVLAKVSVPLVIVPLVTFAIVVALQLIMLLAGSAVLAASGLDAGLLWSQWLVVQGWVVLLYGLAANALWFAPFYGWLLFVSAWAPRATFLWAFLPLIVVQIIERIAFNTGYFGSILSHHVRAGFSAAFTTHEPNAVRILGLGEVDPIKFVTTPELWIGLAIGVAFVATTVWLRRNRGPI